MSLLILALAGKAGLVSLNKTWSGRVYSGAYVVDDIGATMSTPGLCRVGYKSVGSEGVRRGIYAI